MPVNVSGIKEMKKALGLVDKDLLKEVQGEIAQQAVALPSLPSCVTYKMP